MLEGSVVEGINTENIIKCTVKRHILQKTLFKGEKPSFHYWIYSLFLLSHLMYTLLLLKLKLLKINIYLENENLRYGFLSMWEFRSCEQKNFPKKCK